MKMIFFEKCIVYMQREDLIIHEKIRIKNVFRFSLEDGEYCSTLIDILIEHTDYNIEELDKEIGLLITFIKLVKEVNVEDYQLYILIKEKFKEMLK